MEKKMMPDDSVKEPPQKKRKITIQKQIDISHSNAKSLEEIEFGNEIVESFNASRNYLTSTALKPLRFPNLKILILSSNNLTELPPLRYVPNCVELHLSNNKITSISDELLHLKFLKILDLKKNLITSLTNLDNCTELEWLSLSSNKLENLKGLPKFKKLKFLGLFGNNLSDETKTLETLIQLPQLEQLRISANPICSITYNEKEKNENQFRKQLIAKLPNLKWLDDDYIGRKL